MQENADVTPAERKPAAVVTHADVGLAPQGVRRAPAGDSVRPIVVMRPPAFSFDTLWLSARLKSSGRSCVQMATVAVSG